VVLPAFPALHQASPDVGSTVNMYKEEAGPPE